MSIKTSVVDASSVIILAKVGLLQSLGDMYRVILAGSVYREITAKPESGAAECRRWVGAKKISVQEIPSHNLLLPQGLDTGEAETIELFNAGHGDFIITDDGAAARYCTREGIPFINALLLPVVMYHAQLAPVEFCIKAFTDIQGIGRYSDRVVSSAREFCREDLSFALP